VFKTAGCAVQPRLSPGNLPRASAAPKPTTDPTARAGRFFAGRRSSPTPIPTSGCGWPTAGREAGPVMPQPNSRRTRSLPADRLHGYAARPKNVAGATIDSVPCCIEGESVGGESINGDRPLKPPPSGRGGGAPAPRAGLTVPKRSPWRVRLLGERAGITPLETHKRLGIMYTVNGFSSSCSGGIEELLIRLQLVGPRPRSRRQQYKPGLHCTATTMVFLVMCMAVSVGFGQYIVPLSDQWAAVTSPSPG